MRKESQWFHQVCLVGQLIHAECLEFTLPQNLIAATANSVLPTTEAFMVNWHDEYVAYLNCCPHTQVNLNWMPNQFLDIESRFLQCSLHGAIFEPQTGLCIRGPCLGQSLTPLPTVVQGKVVSVDLQALINL